MTDRDTFAAAALTGLLANEDLLADDDKVAETAYELADAMLRERSRAGQKMSESDIPPADFPERESTNLDAAPAARANAESVAPQPTAGDRSGNPTSHSGTGKQPAPPRVETDGFSPGSRTGPIIQPPERESPRRECGESSLRDVSQLDNSRAAGGPEHSYVIDGVDRPVSYAETDEKRVFYDTKRDTTEPRNGALSGCETVPDADSRVWETPCTPQPQATPPQGSVQGEGSFRVSQNANEPVAWANFYPDEEMVDFRREYVEQCSDEGEVVPLYRHTQPTLTDEDREAIELAYSRLAADSHYAAVAATLRGLLERLK